jgi:hypothetical protein
VFNNTRPARVVVFYGGQSRVERDKSGLNFRGVDTGFWGCFYHCFRCLPKTMFRTLYLMTACRRHAFGCAPKQDQFRSFSNRNKNYRGSFIALMQRQSTCTSSDPIPPAVKCNCKSVQKGSQMSHHCFVLLLWHFIYIFSVCVNLIK